MIKKINNYNFRYFIFIFSCLMLPRNPQIYTMFCSILISLFIYPVKLKFNIYSKLILSLILFILIGSVIRFFTSFQVNFRDYLEAIHICQLVSYSYQWKDGKKLS